MLRTYLLLAGLLLSSMAGAQSQADQKTAFRRYTGPLKTLELDLETGVITRGPVVHDRALVTCDTFLNTDLGGFVGADTGSCACEWYDAGTKNGGKSTLISGFRFAYCSAALDILSGGPGGAASVIFNEGYTLGGNGPGQPPNGTDVARICLTGLPANTACSSFFGGFACYFITITFNSTFCLADGNIGYGWKFKDLGTDGVLAKTFPFLSCVTSCTGPGPDAQGMVDMVDQYCPPGFLNQTFSFGTTPFGGYFTSVSMQIREAASTGLLPDATLCGGNPVLLADKGGTIGFGPLLGVPTEPFAVSIDCSGSNGAGVFVVKGSFGRNPTSVGLCLVPPLFNICPPLPHNNDLRCCGPFTLPKFLPFACLAYSVQGACTNPVRLSTAIRETIGL